MIEPANGPSSRARCPPGVIESESTPTRRRRYPLTLITAARAAEIHGMKPSTWNYYQWRRRNQNKGSIPLPVEHHGPTAMYDEDEVRAWKRPGRGARTDLIDQEDSKKPQD